MKFFGIDKWINVERIIGHRLLSICQVEAENAAESDGTIIYPLGSVMRDGPRRKMIFCGKNIHS
jgi:hypothetical protein